MRLETLRYMLLRSHATVDDAMLERLRGDSVAAARGAR